MFYCPDCQNTGYVELWWPEMKVLIGVARCLHRRRVKIDD